MRKILFLLLLTVASHGQTTTGKETKFPYGIRNQSVQTITTPTYLNTQGTDGTQGIIPSAYIEKTENKISTIYNYATNLYTSEKAVHDALDLKLNISDLPTNLTLYPTTTTSDVSGYVVMVKDIHDVRYNTTALDVSTPTITTTDQLVSQRISDAGILIGQPGVFNITTFGNIRHLSGSGTATFYFKVFHRDSAGVETLICTSSISSPVTDGGYSEFTASGVWDDGDFIASDRIVIKSYANRIAGGSDPVYQFQFGGTSPVRTLLPVPFSVVDAGYELSANKQNSLAIDGTGTKYPTVDAVNAGLPVNYSKIVYVNATSPITATIFDTENPPVTNDNLLKNDVANLYIGTDASTWVYNSTTYVTKTVPSTSNFNNFGTTVDAGSSKTSHITRSGAVTLTGPLNILNLKVSSTPVTSAGSYDILTRNSSTTALEKKLVSDFVQTIGAQSVGGDKSFTGNISTKTIFASSGTSGYSIYLDNTLSGNGLSGRNYIGGNFIYATPNSGNGFYFDLLSSTTGKGGIFNSASTATGNLLEFLKNSVLTTSINHLGEINTMIPTVSTQVATKGYTDSKITQTITNGVTDKSPSEDAVFDALVSKVSGSGTTNKVSKFTSAGVIGDSNITDSGTLVSTNTDMSINSISIGRGGGNMTTNIVFGNSAGVSNTTGSSNIYIGSNAGALANSSENTVVGASAGISMTGSANTFIGQSAGKNSTTGLNNTFLGQASAEANTSGSENVILGRRAMLNGTTGSNNLISGVNAGRFIADGATSATIINNSVLLGYNAKPLANSQTNQIVIGYNSTGLGSNTTVLGNGSTVSTWLGGNVLIGTTVDSGNKLKVNGDVLSTQYKLSALNTAPASATDTGTLGEVRITATYIYVCTATNTWVRTALATW